MTFLLPCFPWIPCPAWIMQQSGATWTSGSDESVVDPVVRPTRGPHPYKGLPTYIAQLVLLALFYFGYTASRTLASGDPGPAEHHAANLLAREQWLHIDIELWLNYRVSERASPQHRGFVLVRRIALRRHAGRARLALRPGPSPVRPHSQCPDCRHGDRARGLPSLPNRTTEVDAWAVHRHPRTGLAIRVVEQSRLSPNRTRRAHQRTRRHAVASRRLGRLGCLDRLA